MTQALLLAAALFVPGAPADNFVVQAELQGLYDEISQATLQFTTATTSTSFTRCSVPPTGSSPTRPVTNGHGRRCVRTPFVPCPSRGSNR